MPAKKRSAPPRACGVWRPAGRARRAGPMISAGRCNSGGGGGRSAAMSKDRRAVNGAGAGYVNRCEQALDEKNEMVMAGSGDQQLSNGFGLNFEQANKDFAYCNLKLVEHLKSRCTQFKQLLEEKEETIKRLSIESETVSICLSPTFLFFRNGRESLTKFCCCLEQTKC